MFDEALIVGFDWDAGNARKSVDKHAVSQRESEQIFFNAPLFVVLDAKHSGNELRIHAFGKTDAGRRLHVSFTLRAGGTMIRVISARDMSAKERKWYGSQSESS